MEKTDDPRRPELIVPFQTHLLDPEQLPPDYNALLSLLSGVAGLTFKIKICSWMGLLFSLASITTMKSSEMDMKQVSISVMFACMGITINYFQGSELVMPRQRKIYAIGLTSSLIGLIYQNIIPKESMHRSLQTTTFEEHCNLPTLFPFDNVYVSIVALLYLFVALAIVCDDFFVSALEKITQQLQLSEDVAGATFMAAGSSAPELFVSLADNVFTKPGKNMGIGTIVGSALFNILIIIALTALLSKQTLFLDWRPMLRDSLWYIGAIALLAYFIHDNEVDIYESCILLGTYFLYILYMSQNERIVQACCLRQQRSDGLSQEEQDAIENVVKAVEKVQEETKQDNTVPQARRAWTIDVERVAATEQTALPRKHSQSDFSKANSHALVHHETHLNPIYRSKYRVFQHHPHFKTTKAAPLSEKEIIDHHSANLSQSSLETPVVLSIQEEKEDELVSESYFEELYDIPTSYGGKLWFLFTWPIVVVLKITIPDCRYTIFSSKCGYIGTFVMSIVWLGILCHYAIFFATKLGCHANIPFSLMGLTILAAGTSIPDAFSSILVARDGQGDMAVSNAIGSNVFDICLGLGLPFLLSNCIYHEPVQVSTNELTISLLILFAVLLYVVVLLICTKWYLYKIVGIDLAFRRKKNEISSENSRFQISSNHCYYS